jgi:hypothetical protein
VYLGDHDLKALLFITPEQEHAALSVDLSASPLCAVIVNDDKALIIGCEEGCLKIVNLERPDEPKVTQTIKLQKSIYAILELNAHYIFCGQKQGYMDICKIKNNKYK